MKAFIIVVMSLINTVAFASISQTHAKELLGKYFARSPASKPLSTPLKALIATELVNHLPRKHKAKAKKIADTIISQAEKHGLDPMFVMSVIKTESYFNPDAVGGVGELGLMQLRPETAKWIDEKQKISFKGKKDLKNPLYNITVGTAYLAYLRDHFDNAAAMYLPAYNAGPNKVKSLFEKKSPPVQYSLKVMKNYKEFYRKWVAKEAS